MATTKQGQVTKIYELKTLGYNQISNELRAIDTLFDNIRKSKLGLNKEKSKIEDPVELARINKELGDLKIKEGELKIAKQQLNNEAKAGLLVRQQEAAARKLAKQGIDAEEGSIIKIRKSISDLNALLIQKNQKGSSTISFQNEILTIDQARQKLQGLITEEQNFRRQFAKDGLLVAEYSSGIIQAFNKLGLGDLVTGQLKQQEVRVQELNQQFELLNKELSQVKVNGKGSLETVERALIANRKEAIALNENIGFMRNELRGVGDAGSQMTGVIERGFRNIKSQAGSFALQFIGIQQLFFGLQSGVGITKDLADQTSNLEVELGKAEGGVGGIVKELAKLDTRTKLSVLEDIANIAAKAGTSEQNLVGVTQAIDKIKIAFGKDFGDVEKGTEDLVKIVNIFEGANNVTGDNLLRTGNAVRVLANESVASVPFITDFTKRMAGLRGISDITLPSVLGLASGFEQFGQSAEVSSTALVRIIPKLANNTRKYAEIAGVTVEQFKKVLNENPAEALLLVSEGLVKGKKDIESISEAFADSQLGKGRIASVLGVLGKNADTFRKSIESAGGAFKDTSSITDSFNRKNENLAGTLDKISKKFADAANTGIFKAAILGVASALTLLLSSLPVLLVLLGLYGIGWLTLAKEVTIAGVATDVTNATLLRQRIALQLNNIILGVNTILTTAARAAQIGYNAVLNLFPGFAYRAAYATGIFGSALRALPFLGLISLIGLLFIGIKSFAGGMTSINTQLKLQNKLYSEISQEANRRIADQQAKVAALAATVVNLKDHQDDQLRVMKELIAIDPSFSKALKDQKVDYTELAKATDEYNKKLREQALLEVTKERQTKEFRRLGQVTNLRQELEIFKATPDKNKEAAAAGLSEEARKVINEFGFRHISRLTGSIDFNAALDDAIKNIKLLEKQQQQIAEAATNLLVQNQTGLKNAGTPDGKNDGKLVGGRTIELIKADLKDATDAFETSVVGSSEYKTLKAKVEALNEELRLAEGKSAGGGKNKRTAEQIRDEAIKNIQDQFEAEKQLLEIAKAKKQQLNGDNTKAEEEYQIQLNIITQKYALRKLGIVEKAQKDEKKRIAEFQLDIINSQNDTNEKLFQIAEKKLQHELDQQEQVIKDKRDQITEDPLASDLAKANARKDADTALLDLQIKFNAAMSNLEKIYGILSIDNEKKRADAVRKIRLDLYKDNIDQGKSELKQVQDEGQEELSAFKRIIAQARLAITNSNLSDSKKQKQLAALDKQEKLGLLAREVQDLQNQLPVYNKLLKEKIITDKEYDDFITKLRTKEQELADGFGKDLDEAYKKIKSTKELVQSALRDLLNIRKGSGEDNLLGEAISQTYSLAQDAMNSYFDAERNRIEQSKQSKIDALDLEKQQLLAKAQSKGEEDSINRQYDKKKRAIEKEAFERNKDIQKKQVYIQLATETAANAVAAAQNPLNGPTFGTAGLIQFAVFEALSIARAAIQVNAISSQKFARGGAPDTSTTRGGEVGGRPHDQGGNPFMFQGRVFEDEVKELNVIRTKNAPSGKVYTISGTQRQIASSLNEIGGGVRFAGGASVRKYAYGGNLGESLQAPVFQPASSTTIITSGAGDQLKTLEAVVEVAKGIQAVNSRIDNLQVIQVTSSVTSAQKKEVKQNSVGTL